MTIKDDKLRSESSIEEDQAEPSGNLVPSRLTPDGLADSMVRKITQMVHDHHRLSRRYRRLRVFGAEGDKLSSADGPEMEMIFERRDAMTALKEDIVLMKERLKYIDDPETYTELQRMIGAKESRFMDHMKEIEKNLATVRKHEAGRESLMSKLLTDRAKLAQDAKHHREKLLAEMNKADEKKSEEATVMRLCKEYNVTPEVVYERYLRKPMPTAVVTEDAQKDAG